MSAGTRAFERLEAANPLTDTTSYEPTRTDAIEFLRRIEEGTMDTQTATKPPETPRRRGRGWAVAGAAFVAVLAAGAVVVFIARGDDAGPVTNDSPPSTTEVRPAEAGIEEPAVLAELRAAVNGGDAVAAASLHTGEGSCDRFFTIGEETCADWYGFLVGIGTRVTAADCRLDPDAGKVGCWWTVESDAHRALGIDAVAWRFTSVDVDGWGSAQPDGNLFTGIVGLGALDDDFWASVSSELVRQKPELAEAVATSNRVPATLNAELAAVVLGAARSFPGE